MQAAGIALTDTAKSVWQLVSVLLVFVLVLGLTYFATKWVARLSADKLKCSNISVIETYRITQNKFIQIIKIGENYLAISVTKDNVSLLTKLDGQTLNLFPDVSPNRASFSEIIERVAKGISKAGEGPLFRHGERGLDDRSDAKDEPKE